MSPTALLSCLGFPGWGPLHLVLEEQDPERLLQRLSPLAQAQALLPAGRLLPLVLQCLDHPSPWWQRPLPPLRGQPCTGGSRYRLVCRRGGNQPLRLRIWLPPEPGSGHWRDGGTHALDPRRAGLGLRQSIGQGDAGSPSGW